MCCLKNFADNYNRYPIAYINNTYSMSFYLLIEYSSFHHYLFLSSLASICLLQKTRNINVFKLFK